MCANELGADGGILLVVQTLQNEQQIEIHLESSAVGSCPLDSSLDLVSLASHWVMTKCGLREIVSFPKGLQW